MKSILAGIFAGCFVVIVCIGAIALAIAAIGAFAVLFEVGVGLGKHLFLTLKSWGWV